jgi:hypothetical protein
MAIIKVAKSRSSVAGGINYVTKEAKTEKELIATKDCNPHTAIQEMNMTKEQWNKTEGRQYKHYVQSFNPKDNVTPEQAHEIGKKFMEHEKFKGHEIVMATHKDKEHIHNHFIVNSVNFENGMKYHEKKQELQNLKEYSNSLCKEQGLSIPIKGQGQGISIWDQGKYRAVERGVAEELKTKQTGEPPKYKAHIYECYKTVDEVRGKAIDRGDFINKMKERGYETTWKDNKKHIVFEDKEGNKFRNSNLEKTFGGINDKKYGKEDLENEFRRNDERGRAEERDTSNRGTESKQDDIYSRGNERVADQVESDRGISLDSDSREQHEGTNTNERIERDREGIKGDREESESDLEQFNEHLRGRKQELFSAFEERAENDREPSDESNEHDIESTREHERAEQANRERIERQRGREFDDMER